MSFFTMRQGTTESNNSFLNRFKSNVHNLELVGGSNFMYSTEHVELRDGAVNTNTDRNKVKDKSLVIYFLKRDDVKRYRPLLEQLQKGAYLGREEYDTLIRFSGQFNAVVERYQQNTTRNKGRG